MSTVRIRHVTSYSYDRLVALSPHRLMLRPRESRDVRVKTSSIEISPSATLTWASDVFGNAVATASFFQLTDCLIVTSECEVELNAAPWPTFTIAPSATSYPFLYSADEWQDLGTLTVASYADPNRRLQRWASAFVAGPRTDTLSLLKDLSHGITGWIAYQSRDEEGTQAPLQTIDRGWGTCRDFAVLFVDAARSLGFGARLVSGYLYSPDTEQADSISSGSTHAWAEVYVPGAGWITFDPTNRSVGGFNLIPVAVARDIAQVVPVSGSFVGMPGSFNGMRVNVSVSSALADTSA